MDAAENSTLPPGDSSEQRQAERHMLDALGVVLHTVLEPTTITVDSGVRVEIDGANSDRSTLVECFAHLGPPKGAQRHKPIVDGFKLTWVAKTLPEPPRLILCFSDEGAARPFRSGKSWAAQALRDEGIEVQVVAIPDSAKKAVQAAQTRQYR